MDSYILFQLIKLEHGFRDNYLSSVKCIFLEVCIIFIRKMNHFI